jgi:asparagine synthase (glutamine-hydrolysing)
MCGFAGVVRRGRPVAREEMEPLLPWLARRGPDGTGVLVNGGIALAASRLAVQGGAEAAQPLRGGGGRFALVYNGELFASHRRALRQRMRAEGAGEAPATSDTALLLAWLSHRLADRASGDPLPPEALAPLTGAMYAFAVADLVERDVLLASDGAVKPLHVRDLPERGETWFSSTVAPLLVAVPGPRTADLVGLATRLYLPVGDRPLVRVAGDLSEVRGPAASVLERGGRGRAPLPVPPAHESGPTGVDALHDAWSEAAREAGEVDGAVSVFLSGGLDSSAVAAWCGRPDVLAVTGRFAPAGGAFDESDLARTVADALGIAHDVLDLSDRDLLQDLPGVVRALEEPVGGPGSLALHRVAAHARAHGRVALSGTGGDERLAGYARVALALGREGPFASGYEPLARRMAAAGSSPRDRWLAAVDRSDDLLPYLSADFRASLPLAEGRARARGLAFPGAEGDGLLALVRAERETTLPMLLRVEDRVTMDLALESRPVPCLGRVPAVASRLPPSDLVGADGEGKAALREALRGAIPESVRTSPVKRGFPTPFARAARGAGRDLAEATVGSRAFAERGWWDVAACRSLLGPGDGRGAGPDEPAGHDRAAFAVLALETWARLFLDGEAFAGGGP